MTDTDKTSASSGKPPAPPNASKARPPAQSPMPPARQRLQNIPLPAGLKKTALPALLSEFQRRQKNGTLPRATWVYASASAAFFVLALASVIRGAWFSGFLIFVIAVTLLAFGLFYLKNPDA
ncbi:MAG: hypothetical protein EBQ89_10110 [Alphaproteobacteria bacterium]|nr:hypothetical protein [Alphaproteobacteria bacterium]